MNVVVMLIKERFAPTMPIKRDTIICPDGGRSFFWSDSEPENLKKSRPKKFMKSNKSTSPKNFFDPIPFFAISKMANNQFLNWEKV